MPRQQVSMIMIGATDVQALRRFYEQGLGWTPWRSGGSGSGSIMYKVGYSVLVFLKADYLSKERGEGLSAGSKASLAIFVESEAAVNEDIAKAVAVGAMVTSAARQRDGGIYSGYFADPEGNSWEIAWSSNMPMSASGELVLNP
jgi:predicted lactoylglutathione lyase